MATQTRIPEISRTGFPSAPARLRWPLENLVTRDGHRLTLAFSATARAMPDPAERKLFEETFSREASGVTPENVVAHFTPALLTAAESFAGKQAAEVLLADNSNGKWIDVLKAAGNAVAFACGIELLAPFTVEIASPSLQKERLEQMQRTAAERQAVDRLGHFQRAAELLRQWESLKLSAPGITPGQLLSQVSASDRGAMLETLMSASASQADDADLWAVAGPTLVRIDLRGDSPQTKLIPLPTTAGPLRSVQAVDNCILVGARTGVILINREAIDRPAVYLDPDLQSEHGFSRVTLFNHGVWACHRDGGIVGWNIDQTDRPMQSKRPVEIGGSPKNLLRVAAGLLFSVDNRLQILNTAGDVRVIETFAAPIVSIVAATDRVVVALENGAVVTFDTIRFERTSESQPAGRLTSASLLPWLSSHRLLLTTADGPVYCVGLDDQLVSQFTGPHSGLRATAGSASHVAALSPDRQRIVVWNSAEGRRPANEIFLTNLTRHRVADIAFG